MSNKLLLIEDDESIRDLLDVNIRYLGYEVDYSADGKEGLEMALKNDYCLVILDVNLPGLGGFEVCKQIRKENERVPLIILSARTTELDRVLGLEIGADDYLTKPFSVAELMARIKVRLKHAGNFDSNGKAQKASTKSDEGELLNFAGLEIDIVKRKVTLDGQTVSLTAKEFDLLYFLAQHPGRPFTRDDLLESVWGVSAAGYENNVNALITRLRRKIESNPNEPRFLKTVWGVGYRFAEAEEL